AELDLLRNSADLAAESLRLTNLRYQGGEATVLEVVDAQNTLTQARNAFNDGEVRARTALANLQTLTGTMIHPTMGISTTKIGLAWYIALLAILPLAITGCGKADKEEAPEVAVQAAPATKTDISRVVTTEAVIFPIAQSAITPKISAP